MRAPAARLLLAILCACSADPLGERELPPPPGPTRLHDRTPALPLTLRCQPAQHLIAVGPEGSAWFDADGTLEEHTVDGRVLNRPRPEVDAIAAAHAIGPGELVVVDDLARVWVVSAESVAPLHFPDEGGTPRAFCGDPRQDLDGYVLTELGLHERSAERWWHVDPAGPVRFGALTWLATRDGSCAGPEGALYLAEDDHVWRLADEGIRRVDELGDPSVAPTRLGPFVASASVDTLVLGSPEAGFAEVELPARATALSGAGETLWVATDGGGLFVLRGTGRDATWGRATEDDLDLEADDIHAHAGGGAWLARGDELCHAAFGQTIAIEGLRAHARIAERRAAVVVRVASPSGAPATGTVELQRDGALEGSADLTDGVAVFEDVSMGDSGWHELVVVAGAAERQLPYRVVQGTSWGATVAPIAEASCATADCHAAGSTDPPDLSSFEAWVDFAPSIRGQVVSRQMPRDPALPLEETEIMTIVEWIEGGMQE